MIEGCNNTKMMHRYTQAMDKQMLVMNNNASIKHEYGWRQWIHRQTLNMQTGTERGKRRG